MMKSTILAATILALLIGGLTVTDARAQTPNCLTLIRHPVLIDLCHDGTVIDQVLDDFGELVDVYLIEEVNFTNLTGQTWRLSASDDQGISWTSNITPNDGGTRNIPPPNRYRSYPLSFGVTLVRP
jgi:hypothetical protein